MNGGHASSQASCRSASTNSSAYDILGNWSRCDGSPRVNCGSQICATNTWIKDPIKQNEKVGDRLIFKIKAANNEWSGSAYDPQRKLKLSAKLKAAGEHGHDRLYSWWLGLSFDALDKK